jgi:hypothetical protein
VSAAHIWHALGSAPVAARIALALLLVIVPDGVWSLSNRAGRAVAWLDARLKFRSPVVRRHPEPVHCWHADGSHDTDSPPAPQPAVLPGDDWDGLLSDTPEPVGQPAGHAELGDAFELIEACWEQGESPGPLPRRDALHVPPAALPQDCTDLFGGPPSKAQIERGIVDLLVHTWREHERQFGGAS